MLTVDADTDTVVVLYHITLAIYTKRQSRLNDLEQHLISPNYVPAHTPLIVEEVYEK